MFYGCFNMNRFSSDNRYPFERCFPCSGRTDGIVGARGPMGPMGPQGAQGPQGERGPAGINDAIYASLTGGTYATDALLPITQTASTPTTTMSVTANAVNVQPGTYLVTFGANGINTDTTGGDFSVQLYANGTAIPNEIATDDANATQNGSVTKSLIYTATAPTALSIHNVSAGESTYDNAYMTVLKLS